VQAAIKQWQGYHFLSGRLHGLESFANWSEDSRRIGHISAPDVPRGGEGEGVPGLVEPTRNAEP
jgi:hypothetical protein